MPLAKDKEKEKSSMASAKDKEKEKSATASASSETTRTPSSSNSSGRVASRHEIPSGEHLARLTAYWASEGDYYTERMISATGVHLHDGHCAVDPSIFPYGSVVEIAGVGKYLAVDTGSAVISRTAAREAAHNERERNALVIDLFFESRRDGEEFAASGPKYATITWWTPTATNSEAVEARNLFADENWSKIRGKQL
jgi:3D (Asp-Asp-Asp) domain-containing protein